MTCALHIFSKRNFDQSDVVRRGDRHISLKLWSNSMSRVLNRSKSLYICVVRKTSPKASWQEKEKPKQNQTQPSGSLHMHRVKTGGRR